MAKRFQFSEVQLDNTYAPIQPADRTGTLVALSVVMFGLLHFVTVDLLYTLLYTSLFPVAVVPLAPSLL